MGEKTAITTLMIKTCAKRHVRVRHCKIILTNVFSSRKPSPTCQITNGTSGGIRRAKFLGPRRVRNGPIALLKVNDRQKSSNILKRNKLTSIE